MIKPNWQAPNNVHAFTTTIAQGSMSQRFPADGDSQLNIDQLIYQHAIPQPITLLNQVHANTCVQLPTDIPPHDADACMSITANTPCIVLTADCLPILITNQQGSLAAAVHAGWRGILSGVIQSCIRTIDTQPDQLMAWLGPAIGPDAFEVNEAIYRQFITVNPNFETAFKITPTQQVFASLYTLANIILTSLGIMDINSHNYCTYSNDDLFYSHRRQKDTAGRMASMIWFE